MPRSITPLIRARSVECAHCQRIVAWAEITRRAPTTGRHLCARCDKAVTKLITGRSVGFGRPPLSPDDRRAA